MKKAIVSVINDLVTDQRVNKTCIVLSDLGFEVLLVGRVKKDSPPLPTRNYRMHRMRLLFEKGPMFYAEYNIRLFFFLLFRKARLLVSNDLDTLLPNFIIHKIKKPALVYDSHELFTETPEVIHRKFVKSVWERIEKMIFPKLTDVITVSDSIAKIFEDKYSVPVIVVRNIPPAQNYPALKSKQELNLPEDKKILILQGSGINIQRGAEELVESMAFLKGYLLLIVGGGDVIDTLKQISKRLKLVDKIRFFPRQSIDNLYHYTRNADLGLSLDKDTNLNYRYSLPNKLFDYIHAGIPVLASPLVEVGKIIDQYKIGSTITEHQPEQIAHKIEEIFYDTKQFAQWKENLKFAEQELNWDKEKQNLVKVFSKHA